MDDKIKVPKEDLNTYRDQPVTNGEGGGEERQREIVEREEQICRRARERKSWKLLDKPDRK